MKRISDLGGELPTVAEHPPATRVCRQPPGVPTEACLCSAFRLTPYVGLEVNESSVAMAESNISSEEHDLPLSQYERSVVLFNLHVEMVPRDAGADHDVSLERAFTMVVDAWRAGEAKMRVGEYADDEGDEDAARVRVNEISIEQADWVQDGVLTLLIHHGDSRATDPALKNLTTREIRTAGKTREDAVAHAAHLMVSTEMHLSRSGQGRALLERVPNLGRTAITSLLNRAIRTEARRLKMRYYDPETKSHKSCHPKLVGHYQLSRGLRADLEGGKLHGVEFITRRVAEGYEDRNRIVPIVRTLRHRVLQSPMGDSLFAFIEQLKMWGRANNYEEMQLHFTKENTKQQLSPRVSTELEDAEDALYARLELICDFSTELVQCPEEIVTEIQEKMRPLLDASELWS